MGYFPILLLTGNRITKRDGAGEATLYGRFIGRDFNRGIFLVVVQIASYFKDMYPVNLQLEGERKNETCSENNQNVLANHVECLFGYVSVGFR